MVIALLELLNLVIATLVVGYIFSGIVKFKKADILDSYKRFDFEEFKFAVLVAAPGVILHELSHKFVAIGLGLSAVFQIWPTGLILGVVMKLLNSPLVLVTPGYVSIEGANTIEFVLTAFAGPFVNLVLWIGASFLLSKKIDMGKKSTLVLLLTKEVNKWLFIFNMIPIPPLDGSKVLYPLFGALF